MTVRDLLAMPTQHEQSACLGTGHYYDSALDVNALRCVQEMRVRWQPNYERTPFGFSAPEPAFWGAIIAVPLLFAFVLARWGRR